MRNEAKRGLCAVAIVIILQLLLGCTEEIKYQTSIDQDNDLANHGNALLCLSETEMNTLKDMVKKSEDSKAAYRIAQHHAYCSNSSDVGIKWYIKSLE